MPKISDLGLATTPLAGTESVPLVQSATTKKTTPADIATYVKSGLVKGDVGLGNVDNTSDANKPVSTAQQTALDGKQPLNTRLTNIAAASPSGTQLVAYGATNSVSLYTIGSSTGNILDKASGDGLYLAQASYIKGISGFCSGKPGASETVLGAVAPYAFTITQANCVSKAGTAATASTTFTIKNNGSSIGTIVYSASGTTGAVTISTSAVAAGDLVTISAPSSADASIADVSFLLKA